MNVTRKHEFEGMKALLYGLSNGRTFASAVISKASSLSSRQWPVELFRKTPPSSEALGVGEETSLSERKPHPDGSDSFEQLDRLPSQ